MFRKLLEALSRKQLDFDKLNRFQLSLVCNVKAGNILKVI